MKVMEKVHPFAPQHPMAMDTTFRHCFLVNYRMPPKLLAAALPRGLEPDLGPDGQAYLSVVIADLEAMRPAFLGRELGFDFTQVVYRAIVRSPEGERGVYFVRSDADSELMSIAGNLISNFKFNLADVVWAGRNRLAPAATGARQRSAGFAPSASDIFHAAPPPGSKWLPSPAVEGAAGGSMVGAEAHFMLEARETDGDPAGIRASFDLVTASLTMPASSSFAGQAVAEGQRFFVELYAAFDSRPVRDHWTTVRIDRTKWDVVAFDLSRIEIDFMDRGPKFNRDAGVEFDSCFYVNALDYHWHKLEKKRYIAPPEATELWSTTTMFYDGQCPLCSKEVAHYKRLAADNGSQLRFVDISGADGGKDGELSRAFGVTNDVALERIHVVEKGTLLTGVAGFVAVWKTLPYWKYLAKIFKAPGAVTLAEVAYNVFAQWRNRKNERSAPVGVGGSCRIKK